VGRIGEDVTESWRMMMVKMTLKYIATMTTMADAVALRVT
jgi:hypothetical protein